MRNCKPMAKKGLTIKSKKQVFKKKGKPTISLKSTYIPKGK